MQTEKANTYNFFDRISDMWRGMKGNYFVIASTSKGDKYLKYEEESGQNDFIDDPKKATIFDVALGALIVKKMKGTFTNLDFSLQTVQNALFINNVFHGAPQYNTSGKQPTISRMRITKPGYLYFAKFPSVGNKNMPPDMAFLAIMANGQWHTRESLPKNIPDLDEIIKAAHENNLIETE